MRGVLRWPLVARSEQVESFEELLQGDETGGLLIVGPAGVGKTRLAEECAWVAHTEGRTTERLVGSDATSGLPLSSGAPLLPAGLPDTSFNVGLGMGPLLETCRRSLEERHPGSRLVVIADDLHRFDVASLALVAHLTVHRTILLVGTVRTGDPVPDVVTSLWRDHHLVRFDVSELERSAVDTLLHLALGAPIESRASRQLWSASGGNPLYLHELVMGAIEKGVLNEREGVWHLDDSLPTTRRLDELVAERMGALEPEGREVVELLSLCQPLDLDYLVTRVGSDTLARLEESGRISVALDSSDVSLGHPLFGEILRQQIPVVRSRQILRREADRLERGSDLSRDERLRVAEWRLATKGGADPRTLIEGARLARAANDFPTVRRLIEGVREDDRGPEGRLLLGEACYELGSFEECEQSLATEGPEVDDALLLRIVVTRTKNLQWGLCDPERAIQVNNKSRQWFPPGPLADELLVNEAAILMFSGHPDQALQLLDKIGGIDVAAGEESGDGILDPEKRPRVIRAIALSPALACAGRTAEALSVAEAGFADHMTLDDEIAIAHPGTHIINQVFSLTEAGKLEEAELVARTGSEIAAAEHIPIAQIWFALNLGRIWLLRGRTATARRFFAEGAGLAANYHFAGPLSMALAGLATASALLGDVAGAQEALGRRRELPRFGFIGPVLDLGEAWTLAASGEPVRAAERFRRAAHDAATTGHHTGESWVLHDLLRAGGGDETDRLLELAQTSDSQLVAVRAQHAAARRGNDPDRLVEVAERFVAMGCLLLAAEALASAGDAYRRSGDQRSAMSAHRRAGALAKECEGSRTPGLLLIGAVDPLSDREREVARLAATGLSSKDIAARLFVSVRTVNNHLQRAYTKLGVNNRSDLARALEETP